VLQCVTVCSSVLQCLAVCCSVLLQCLVAVSLRTSSSLVGTSWLKIYVSIKKGLILVNHLRHHVSQCVAVCCSVVQCFFVFGIVLQCVAMSTFGIMCGSVLQCVAVCGSVLHCVAMSIFGIMCCSVLQCVAVCCRV